MEPTAGPTGVVERKLYRDPQRRLLTGVAAGLAEHLGISVVAVRIIFTVTLPLSGVSAVLYVVFTWVLSDRPGAGPTRPRAVGDLLPYFALGAGVILLSSLLGLRPVTAALGWTVAIIALGAGLIWQLADTGQRKRWSQAAPGAAWLGAMVNSGDRRGYVIRLVGGAALVIVGIIGTIAVFSPISGEGLTALVSSLVFALIAMLGVAVVVAPLLWRLFGQLRTEREGRIREAERAELAAMVHDQVLHTLALIQRNAGDAKTVTRLARGQERSLRNWLYKPTGDASETFAAAIEQAVVEVEDTYAIAVESVVVGDAVLGESLRALVYAAREALVNAARHAQVSTVSLYAEVEPGEVSVFVRDRGVGFDMSKVDHDRHGVRGSIIGRMERHGGSAVIRTEVGGGTEVRLSMPVEVKP